MSDCDVSQMEEWMAQPDLREPTQQQKCAELAKAMGFYIQSISKRFKIWRLFDSKGNTISECGVSSEAEAWGDAPNPFTDHEACHALKVWLAAQSPEAWGNFSAAVIDHSIPFDQQAYADWEMVTRAVMTADPAIIAEAAWQSIQKGNSE